MSSRADRVMRKIAELQRDRAIEIIGDANDGTFADNIYLSVFTKFRIKYNLLLVTQDNNLSKDIIALNNSHSVNTGKQIVAKRISSSGTLHDYYWNSQTKRSVSSSGCHASVGTSEKFRITNEITQIPDQKIEVKYIPVEGDTLYKSDRTTVKLVKHLGGGGEADVFSTDSSLVAKIYKSGQMTQRKKAKIELMLTKSINYAGICYPTSILYNGSGEYVGYLMHTAKGHELARSVFAPKTVFQKKFPNWKKIDTVQLCISILEKIKYLHDRNIIMGDINPSNILVVSPTEVYIVDTDSFQIEGFPCPVGTIPFTAPEIQKKHFESFLRTKGNEYFAVATLLFMIMLPGKPPYSQQGGADQITNIINMDFSYPLGENSNKKAPDGPWKFMWSHLPYRIKKCFYHTFVKDGDYSKEITRLNADAWLQEFREYHRLLSTGTLGQQDSMSETLFPTRHKKNPNATYIRCRLCGNEADEKFCKEGICSECLKKGETYTCAMCGCKMTYTNLQKYVLRKDRYIYCKDCHEKRKAYFDSQSRNIPSWYQSPFSTRQSTPRPAPSSSSFRNTPNAIPARSASSIVSQPASNRNSYTNSTSSVRPSQTSNRQTTATVASNTQQRTSRRQKNQHKTKSRAFRFTVVFAIVSAVLLFIHRMELMEFAFHNSHMLSNGGFVFNVIWPMGWLFIPWMIANGIVLGIASWIEAKLRKRKHPILTVIVSLLITGVVAGFIYDWQHPGFIESIPSAIEQTFNNITSPFSKSNSSSSTSRVPSAVVATTSSETTTSQKASNSQQLSESENGNGSVATSNDVDSSYRVIRADGLTLRSTASTSSQRIASVKQGDIVFALDSEVVTVGSQHWRKVRDGSNNEGWIISDYLEPVDGVAEQNVANPTSATNNQLRNGTTTYSKMNFTIEQTGKSSARLTIVSDTSETWKFAPWVGHTSTVTLMYTDGSKAYADISTPDMFYTYHTQNFDKGGTYVFDLSFEGASDKAWKTATVSIASFLKTHDVNISFQ